MIARGLRVRSRSVTDLPRPVFLVSGDAKFLTVGGGAPVCAITLTGDIAAALGGQPMTISGQTASFVQTDPAQQWYASTPTSLYSPPSSGTVIAEVSPIQTGTAQATGSIVNGDAQNRVQVTNIGTVVFVTVVIAGSEVFSQDIDPDDVVALGVNSDGDGLIFIDGIPLDIGGAADGAFSAGFGLLAVGASMGSEGDTGSITFRTAGVDFTQTYPAGTLDWCGNPIGAAPQAIFLTVSE